MYLVVSFAFEKLFSKSVECFEFFLGFENFEKTAPFHFSSELLHFQSLRVLFTLSMKNDETIVIIEDVQSRF